MHYNFLIPVVSILVIVLIIVLFIVVTTINLNTKKPDGCEEDQNCESCLINCIHNQNKNLDNSDGKNN